MITIKRQKEKPLSFVYTLFLKPSPFAITVGVKVDELRNPILTPPEFVKVTIQKRSNYYPTKRKKKTIMASSEYLFHSLNENTFQELLSYFTLEEMLNTLRPVSKLFRDRCDMDHRWIPVVASP